MAPCVLVRPGETDYEQQGRVVGALGLPLNDEGERQTSEIIDAVRPFNPKVIYTGAQEPSASTARAVGQSLEIPVRKLDALDNVDLGLWQGLLIDEIRQKQPKLFKKWQESPQDVTAPEGEDCDSVVKRVESALRKPLRRNDVFAVVAPEPLATLITTIVLGQQPRLAGPVVREPVGLVELIDPTAMVTTSANAAN